MVSTHVGESALLESMGAVISTQVNNLYNVELGFSRFLYDRHVVLNTVNLIEGNTITLISANQLFDFTFCPDALKKFSVRQKEF